MSTTTTPTRREALKALAMPIVPAVGLAAASAPSRPVSLAPAPERPIAAVKVLLLARVAIAEAETLLDVHGSSCDCSECHSCWESLWALNQLRDALASNMPDALDWRITADDRLIDIEESERSDVVMVRDFLTRRIGDSRDPGNEGTPVTLPDGLHCQGLDHRDPPAALKFMVATMTAAKEADALRKDHGHGCDCEPCYHCRGARALLQYMADMIESVIIWRHEKVNVKALRKFLADRLGGRVS